MDPKENFHYPSQGNRMFQESALCTSIAPALPVSSSNEEPGIMLPTGIILEYTAVENQKVLEPNAEMTLLTPGAGKKLQDNEVIEPTTFKDTNTHLVMLEANAIQPKITKDRAIETSSMVSVR